ncbi:hypothetical protein E2C01_082379 [Portunus trituberculatus]|uniref:Uncharacterized protein n=1 Tax=Portunus trituberculatus TaxID=210409 RepID=A0A5B7J0P8_PORTR|nr:hypothetical protein [Portunus trituberculatus]
MMGGWMAGLPSDWFACGLAGWLAGYLDGYLATGLLSNYPTCVCVCVLAGGSPAPHVTYTRCPCVIPFSGYIFPISAAILLDCYLVIAITSTTNPTTAIPTTTAVLLLPPSSFLPHQPPAAEYDNSEIAP